MSASCLGHYLHVDDGVFFGPGECVAAVNEHMHQAADACAGLGFVVDDREQVDKLLGYDFTAKESRLIMPAGKA